MRFRHLCLLGMLASFAACGGDDTTDPSETEPEGDFTIVVPPRLELRPGQEGTVTVEIRRHRDFDDDITFYVEGLPFGWLSTFEPRVVPADQSESVLTLTARGDTGFDLTVVGFGGGSEASAEMRVEVVEHPVTLEVEWEALGEGVGGLTGSVVNALHASGRDLYVGGRFSEAGGVAVNHIARWDGSEFHPLGMGLSAKVLSMTGWGERGIYVGGGFDQAGGELAKGMARWDGERWLPMPGVDGANSVSALATFGDDLYAGGDFLGMGGVDANRIARWDGSSWSAVGGGVTSSVLRSVISIAISGEDVYIGGTFEEVGGVSASQIAKWDGSTWIPLGEGVGNDVNVIEPYEGADPSRKVVAVGGQFLNVGELSAHYVATVSE